MSTYGALKPHVTIKHDGDLPKGNVFCAISPTLVFGPLDYTFIWYLVTEQYIFVCGTVYLDKLNLFLKEIRISCKMQLV